MSKETVIDAKSDVFNYETLKQKDQKIKDRWISPSFNPGALVRIKDKNNKARKYQVKKNIYYQEGDKKIWLNIGDKISFIK